MKELRGQMVAVLGMLCCPVTSWHPQVRKCRQSARPVCKHTCQIHRARKAIPAVYLPQVELDTSRDVEILLSLQFSLLEFGEKKQKLIRENKMKRGNWHVRAGKS